MLSHSLHNTSGFLIIIAFVSKVGLHFYLDHLSHRSINLNNIFLFPIQYIQPYKGEISRKHVILKRICNLFLLLTAAALIINIISGVLILN
jgi:hypothetical protein